MRAFRRVLRPSVRLDLLATSRQGERTQRNHLGRAATCRRPFALLPRPLQGNLPLVVASRFRNRATSVHAAPATRLILADIEEEPTAGRACLDPQHPVRHQQRNRRFDDSETQQRFASLFRADLTFYPNLLGWERSRDHQAGCPSGLGKVGAEFPKVRAAGRMAREPYLENPLQQRPQFSQSRQFPAWRPASEAQAVCSGQQTRSFAEANGIGELAEIIVRLGCGPVSYRVDEVEGGMAACQFELMLLSQGHCQILSPSKVI